MHNADSSENLISIREAYHQAKFRFVSPNAGSCSCNNWFLGINYRESWERNKPSMKIEFNSPFIIQIYSEVSLVGTLKDDFFIRSKLDTHNPPFSESKDIPSVR